MLSVSYYGEKPIRILYTTLIAVGVLFVLLGILRYRGVTKVPTFWQQSIGRVNFTEKLGPRRYRPTVRYTLPTEREIRTASNNAFNASFEEEEQVIVRYNPLDPREIVVERRSFFTYQIYLFLGIILSGFGFRLFVAGFIRRFRIEFIKENGRKIVPDHTEIGETRLRMPLRKKRVFFLRCRWTDPHSENEYTFLGEALSAPPPLPPEGEIEGKRVFVYFLPRTPEKYYIECKFSIVNAPNGPKSA
jgi:hypothetical protein